MNLDLTGFLFNQTRGIARQHKQHLLIQADDSTVRITVGDFSWDFEEFNELNFFLFYEELIRFYARKERKVEVVEVY